jgi:hypothetical protein
MRPEKKSMRLYALLGELGSIMVHNTRIHVGVTPSLKENDFAAPTLFR